MPLAQSVNLLLRILFYYSNNLRASNAPLNEDAILSITWR
jgi:hypothetical protein